MGELVTFLAGLHYSRFRSLPAVPLLQTTDTFCISAAISHCLQVTVDFGGKSLHALIFKRLFLPIETKRKATCILLKQDYLGRTGRNTQDLALESSTCRPAPSTRCITQPLGSPPALTSLRFHVWFVSWPVCRNHTIH